MERTDSDITMKDVEEMIITDELEEHWDLFLKEEQEAKKKFITWMLEELRKKDRRNPFSGPEKSITDELKEHWEHWGIFLKEEQNAKSKFITWMQGEVKNKNSRVSFLESEIKAMNRKEKKLQEQNSILTKKELKDNKTIHSLAEKNRMLEEKLQNSCKQDTTLYNKKSKEKPNGIKIKVVSDKDIPEMIHIDDVTDSKQNSIEIVTAEEVKTVEGDDILVRILTENVFYGYQGYDLYDIKQVIDSKGYQDVQVKKSDSLKEVKAILSKTLKFDANRMRLWPMARRTIQSLRPYAIDSESNMDKPIIDLLSDTKIPLAIENSEGMSRWTLFLEDVNSKNHMSRFTRFNMDTDVVLFLKYYDPVGARIYFMGHLIISFQSKVSEMIGELINRANQRRLGMNELSLDNIFLFEEVGPNVIVKIEKSEWQETLENIKEEIMDGDIIVFQKKPKDSCKFPTAPEYFADYYIRQQKGLKL